MEFLSSFWQLLRSLLLVALGIFIGMIIPFRLNTYLSSLNGKRDILSPLAQEPVVSITPKPFVLGAQTEEPEHFKIPPTPTPTIFIPSTSLRTSPPTALGTSPPTPTPTPTKAFKKTSYIISLLGDSMLETCLPGCPYLYDALHSLYSQIGFKIYNDSVGAKDINAGLSRLTSEYEHNGVQKPVLLNEPDIIVVESFAYNPWSNTQSDLDKYWLTLAHIVDTIRAQNRKVIFLATIAPNSAVYAKNSAGNSWSEQERWDRAKTVRLYLETFISFAKSQKIPLVDVYHESLDTRGEGDLIYINKSDFLHPSVAGFRLMADRLARGIGELLE